MTELTKEQVWKEEARKAYQDQQSQDNEGGCREPIGFVQGYIAAKKSDFEKISKLENDVRINANRENLSHDLMGELEKLENETKTLKEQLEKAAVLMKTQKDCIDHLLGKKESFGDKSTIGFGKRVDDFLDKYFKDKNGEG